MPSALRRALEVRDRGCRFPGCGLRFTDAHHIEHWADGGRTAIDNLVLLCSRHHRRVHEDGFRVCCDRDGQVVFFTPKGRALCEVPEPPHLDLDEESESKSVSGPDSVPGSAPGHDSRSAPGDRDVSSAPGDPHVSSPLQRLLHRNRARGVAPDWRTGMPRWKRDRDIPREIEDAALEALDA